MGFLLAFPSLLVRHLRQMVAGCLFMCSSTPKCCWVPSPKMAQSQNLPLILAGTTTVTFWTILVLWACYCLMVLWLKWISVSLAVLRQVVRLAGVIACRQVPWEEQEVFPCICARRVEWLSMLMTKLTASECSPNMQTLSCSLQQSTLCWQLGCAVATQAATSRTTTRTIIDNMNIQYRSLAALPDEFAAAGEQFLGVGGDHVPDFVPDVLAADSEDDFVLALEDVDHDGFAVVVGEVGLAGSVGLALLEVGLGLHPVDDPEVVHPLPLESAPDLVVAGAEEGVVVSALPDFEVEGADAVDADVEDGGLEGHFLLLDARGDDEFELALGLHPLVLLDVDVDGGVGGVGVEADGELHGRHRPEDVDLLLGLDALAGRVEQAVLEVGLAVGRLDVEPAVDGGQQEVLLAVVEVVVGLRGLQAVDQFLVGLLLGLEVVQVLVVVQLDGLHLFGVVLVDLLDLDEEVHDDLDVLDLLAGLDFPVVGEAVLVGEDGFGVLGHHHQPDLVLDEREVDLGVLQVLVVVLVPGELEQGGDELELEEEVDAGLVAAVDQLDDVRLDAILQVPAGALQEVQVHVEGELERGDVRLLLGRALPVDESVAQVDQVSDLAPARRLLLAREGVQQGDQELGLEEVVLLVDAVDEPVVLEDVEQQVAVLGAAVGPPAHLDDAPAALVVEDEARVLLLDVLGEFEAVDGQGVLELVRHLEAPAVGHLQQEDVVLQVLLLEGQLLQHPHPPLQHQVARVVLLLLGEQHCEAGEALERDVALGDAVEDLEDLLGEDVQDFVVGAGEVAEEAAEAVELPGPDPGLELPAAQDDVLQLGVVLDPVAVAVGEQAGVEQGGFLLVDEGGGGDEGGDQLAHQLVLHPLAPPALLRPERPEDAAQHLAPVPQAVPVPLGGALEETREDGHDALVHVEVDVLALRGQLEHRQQELREVRGQFVAVGVEYSGRVLLLLGQDGVGQLLSAGRGTFSAISMSLILKRKGSALASLSASILASGSGSVRLPLISSRASSQMGWQQGQLAERMALLAMYLRLRYLLPSATSLLPMGYSLIMLEQHDRYSLTTFRYFSSGISINIHCHTSRLNCHPKLSLFPRPKSDTCTPNTQFPYSPSEFLTERAMLRLMSTLALKAEACSHTTAALSSSKGRREALSWQPMRVCSSYLWTQSRVRLSRQDRMSARSNLLPLLVRRYQWLARPSDHPSCREEKRQTWLSKSQALTDPQDHCPEVPSDLLQRTMLDSSILTLSLQLVVWSYMALSMPTLKKWSLRLLLPCTLPYSRTFTSQYLSCSCSQCTLYPRGLRATLRRWLLRKGSSTVASFLKAVLPSLCDTSPLTATRDSSAFLAMLKTASRSWAKSCSKMSYWPGVSAVQGCLGEWCMGIYLMSVQKLRAKLQEGQLLSEREVEQLADRSIEILMEQGNVVEVRSPQYLIGDVHGQFYDFLKMLREVIPAQSSYVFLGDYVDRGYHSIETICYLLALKCLHPHRFVLLRGNHETASLTRTYGFYDEVMRKYGNHNVWGRIIEVFTYLPLTAVIDSQVLCVHGGLSPSIPYVDQITEIDRFHDIPESGPMCDLVWSDPDPSDREGWSVNNRGAGYIFSKHIVQEFLQMNGLETIVRAHQLVEEGHIYNFGDKSFVTLWSAPNYCYRCGNEASVMKVQGGEYSFLQFEPSAETERRKVHFDNVLPYFL